MLAQRAYRQALTAGDYTLASRAAAVLVRAGKAPPDTALLAFAMALKAKDARGADAALTRIAKGPLDFLTPVLEAWLAVERRGDPMAPIEKARGNVLATRFAAHHRPLLLIATGRSAKAVPMLAEMLSPGADGSDDLRIDAAALLAVSGQRRLAEPLLAGDRADFVQLRKRLGKSAKPGAVFGTARLFLGVAEDIAAQDIPALSILLTRAALLLDPADDRARLFLGEALAQGGHERQALTELGKVAADSPYRRGAQVGLIGVYQRAGHPEAALPLAKALADDAGATEADAWTYGDVLAGNAQYAAAAEAYRVALGRAEGDGGWELHYLYGSALDRAGEWGKALPALRRAVELGPDQAAALEYLGYAQVLRGENLAEAQELLERANRISPDDPGISASLGWAYFTRGDLTRALPLLESAVKGDPGGVVPNEHLGDAYWKLGRRYEARYAWNVAALYAGPEAKDRIAGKLDKGL